MGNILRNSLEFEEEMSYISVEEFNFHGAFEDNSLNGLYLKNRYLPEEIILNILSFIEPGELLRLTLVCKKWCNIIKSDHFWMLLYSTYYPNKAKQLPWYVYYSFFTSKNFKNLLMNTNGEEKFMHWKIIKNFGDEFRIENPPEGADKLPSNVQDFNGNTSCFATSFYECHKIQEVSLKKKRLLRYIIKHHMPHIYVSEWTAGRFDCGCIYQLGILGYGERYDKEVDAAKKYGNTADTTSITPLFHKTKQEKVEQWQGKQWKKVEIIVDKYPENIHTLVFEHEGQDTQFWKGHYGSKMAGGVLRFDFDSIKPIDFNDSYEN